MPAETTGQRILREWNACEFSAPSLVERIDAALAEAQRDTERLDWLGYVGHGFIRGTYFSKWTVESPEEGLRTIRQAIDAARAKAEGERKLCADCGVILPCRSLEHREGCSLAEREAEG